MSRIFIDTDDLHRLSRKLRRHTAYLAEVRIRRTRRWARVRRHPVHIVKLRARSDYLDVRYGRLARRLERAGHLLEREIRCRLHKEYDGAVVRFFGGGRWKLRVVRGWPVFVARRAVVVLPARLVAIRVGLVAVRPHHHHHHRVHVHRYVHHYRHVKPFHHRRVAFARHVTHHRPVHHHAGHGRARHRY